MLAIGGWDPTGSAGLARDLLTAQEFKVAASGVVTALVIQDSRRVHKLVALDPEDVKQQLNTVVADLPFAVWKVGLTPSDEIVEVILAALREEPVARLVVDPVLWSGDRTELVAEDHWRAIRRLLARALVVTPNLAEASALAGKDANADELALCLAPRDGWCVITGGDSCGDNGRPASTVVDWASNGVDSIAIERPRVDAGWVRGTGCAMSSAIAAQLVQGTEPLQAIRDAGEWLAERLATAQFIGAGGGRLP